MNVGKEGSRVAMSKLKALVLIAAIIVLLICIYTFLLGNEVFLGRFSNDGISWYFLAKGIFCSLTLYLLFRVLEAMQKLRSKKGK